MLWYDFDMDNPSVWILKEYVLDHQGHEGVLTYVC